MYILSMDSRLLCINQGAEISFYCSISWIESCLIVFYHIIIILHFNRYIKFFRQGYSVLGFEVFSYHKRLLDALVQIKKSTLQMPYED